MGNLPKEKEKKKSPPATTLHFCQVLRYLKGTNLEPPEQFHTVTQQEATDILDLILIFYQSEISSRAMTTEFR